MLQEGQHDLLLAKIIIATIFTLFMMGSFTEFRYSKKWAFITFGVYMAYIFSTTWFLLESTSMITFIKTLPLFLFVPAGILFYFLSEDSVSKVIFQCTTQVDLFIILSVSIEIIAQYGKGKTDLTFLLTILLFATAAALEYFLLRKPFKGVSKSLAYSWKLLACIPVVFFILLWLIALNEWEQYTNPWMIANVIAVAMVMATVYSVLFMSIVKNHHLLEQRLYNNVMTAQIATQKQHYDILVEKRREIYRMRKQIADASELLWQGQLGRVADIMMDITEEGESDNTRIYCQNPRINNVVAYYATLFIEYNIRFACDIQLGERNIPDAEVALIISHGLENAFEASAKLPMEQRFIKLQSKIVQEQLLIRIKNRYIGNLSLLEGMPGTKKTIAGHGYGLSSIRAAAERAQGEMIIRIEENNFVLDVRLQAEPVEE